MYNRVILVGNLTRDIELRYLPSGSAVGKTGIATSRKFKSASGEQKEEVMFIDLTFFGRTAEIANQYMRKGSKVLVEGRLILEQWTGQDGSKRSRHSIRVENMQMLNSRGDDSSYSDDYSYNQGSYGGENSRYQNSQQKVPQNQLYSQSTSYQQPHPNKTSPMQNSVPEINMDENDYGHTKNSYSDNSIYSQGTEQLSKSRQSYSQPAQQQQPPRNTTPPMQDSVPEIDIDEDEIPF